MTCPASTGSPSRTVISRIRPDVFAATAELSPSMRPLTAITPGGTAGGARTRRHTANPARPATSTATIATRRRRGLMRRVSRSCAASRAATRLAATLGREPVREQVLDVLHVRRGVRRLDRRAPLGEHTLAEPRRGEEEHEAADEAQMRQQRIDGAEVPVAHAARHDALHGAEDPRGLVDQLRVQVRAAGGVPAAGAAASDSSCRRHLASSLAVDSTKHMVNYETCQAWE